jgi:hypothetical protein
MTAIKLRRPDTTEHGLITVMSALGPKAAAKVIGKSPSLLHRASNPDDDFGISVEHCIDLDVAYQLATGLEAPILQAYSVQVEKRSGQLPYHEPAAPMERVMQVMKETVEAADCYRALHLGSTPHERMVMLGEIAEAKEALERMALDVEAQDRPAVLRTEAAE